MPTPSESRAATPDGDFPPNPARRRAVLGLFALTTASALLLGCSGGGSRAAAVDPDKAREALRIALETWKRGDGIEALKTGAPPIVAQDFDWMAGRRLVDFELTGAGTDDDANLRVPVRLTLLTAQGREVQKSVSYVVGTSPTITVFREFN